MQLFTMANKLFYLLVIPLLLAAASCQKELNDGSNGRSAGYLLKDAGGNCSLITFSGTYKASKVLNDTNRLVATVTITKTGTYTLMTDTVNGCLFKATNHFDHTGRQTVSLPGTGTPAAAGTYPVLVKYDTSQCTAMLTVLPAATATPLATYTLTGAPNGCTNAVVSGIYAQNTPLDTAAFVTISLNVITPGAYFIFTNNVNGYSFYGTGVLTATGIQTIRLTASGLPAAMGTDLFTITAATATCTFPVTVGVHIPASVAQYFPLSDSSYWVYDDLQNPPDTLIRYVAGTQLQNGSAYTKVVEQRTYNSRQFLFLKSGSSYLEYAPVTNYTVSVSYSPVQENELLFLKENIQTGDTWQSPEYSGTATFGQLIYIRYNYSCEEANAALSVNGRNFTNVHKIKMYPEIRSQYAGWGSTGEFYNMYYAKGIGLIYFKKINNNFLSSEIAIKRWRGELIPVSKDLPIPGWIPDDFIALNISPVLYCLS